MTPAILERGKLIKRESKQAEDTLETVKETRAIYLGGGEWKGWPVTLDKFVLETKRGRKCLEPLLSGLRRVSNWQD